MEMIFDDLAKCAAVAGGFCSIAAAFAICVKPIREKVFGRRDIENGMKCLLRADMLRIYYKNLPTGAIRQYERENFDAEYKAYKALGGNSFIDDIFQEVKRWKTLS